MCVYTCVCLQGPMHRMVQVVHQACGHSTTPAAWQDQQQQQQQQRAAPTASAVVPWVVQTAMCGPGTAGRGACLWGPQGLWLARQASNQVCI
jgi:hypothetical protein